MTAVGVRLRVEAALGGVLDSPPVIHTVRDVAPNKRMLCVSFQIPASIAFNRPPAAAMTQTAGSDGAVPDVQSSDREEGPSKRQRTSPA